MTIVLTGKTLLLLLFLSVRSAGRWRFPSIALSQIIQFDSWRHDRKDLVLVIVELTCEMDENKDG